MEKQETVFKYDREINELRQNYENQVHVCKKEMETEIERLTTHFEQLSSDEKIRARTEINSREKVRWTQKRTTKHFFLAFSSKELYEKFEQEKSELKSQWIEELERNQNEKENVEQKFESIRKDQINEVRFFFFLHIFPHRKIFSIRQFS